MRILIVFGTRPEAVKLAPLIHDLRQRPGADVEVCLTGQHREMVTQVVSFFGVDVDHDLEIMRPNQTLSDVAARTLTGVDRILESRRPDWVIVQGDTSTCLATALAAFHRKVRVAHVEAGLRSGDPHAPFPEEMNRVLTTPIASLHLAPTSRAKANLRAERVPEDRIRVVGNTGIDALLLAVQTLRDRGLDATYGARFPFLRPSRPLVLVTGHRRESFGQPFEELCEAIRDVATGDDVDVVYPVHLNPNVREPVFRILSGLSNVHLVEPVEYPALVWLAQRSRFILTDSGGIQEEASALGKPVLVMRDVTERQESVEAGVSRLVGTSREVIREACNSLLRDEATYARMARRVDLYGDGKASARIGDALGLPPSGASREWAAA
ncbi:non-hydrolyzing UDP-N-acetylglucosamine 2-epimerase [Anaeromyxobacter sp. Fw109-5]|uniref:non-hydrolyzing UDP-N-acetylglucosamine 2-epimerase n=1 Tax=Anaeromyxobacter sp. (strain Fw109-5) TaxID=404589 RepID=UPI0000ED7E5A|nr:UDP-N-acetylglucosamine 2-epimerase (non-hydrolyzing) [Anaeromyxobacter sp. Fw109-5]ABS25617.1 UDP-N-acetylglucosamine 2-epimerase [Anaeromyxobacter sp. Fw109-5]